MGACAQARLVHSIFIPCVPPYRTHLTAVYEIRLTAFLADNLMNGTGHCGGSLRPDELPERQKALRQISVSECEFSKPVDQVFLIQTGTAPGDIHVADRLSQTSCLFHPDFLPQVKKISTLSDRHLPEGVLFVFKTPISKKKIQKHKILLCKKSLFSLHKQNKEIPYKKS